MWSGGLHHLAGTGLQVGRRSVGATSEWNWVEPGVVCFFGVCRKVEVDGSGGGGRGKMQLGEIFKLGSVPFLMGTLSLIDWYAARISSQGIVDAFDEGILDSPAGQPVAQPVVVSG